MVPNTRFTELLADIEPSPTTKGEASSAHTGVRAHLRDHPEFKNRWSSDFLAGSYKRDTAIRPKKTAEGHERPDVDIIVVTTFSTADHPDDVLDELSDALGEAYDVERINKRSVRIVTARAEIDVVPVVEHGDLYQLPDRDLGHWKLTNPPAHTDWSADQNKVFGGRFKPLVKLLKTWRRENKAGKRPKGFVLEVLVSKHAPKSETHYGEAVAQLLENIYAEYGATAALGIVPVIDDPGLPGNDIMSKVSVTDWKAFIERVRVHAGYARRAQTEQDMEEATRLWRTLFGDRFKATANAAKSDSLARYAAAPAAGSGYTFPSTPAAPANKPRDFA
ncbi:MAG: nucleotidyltransferase [Burkholderiales bacterium 12-64-5]|nr:MAG: nucleotidyltransferase [Burkholderiales bacterium 12-64-5]